MVAKGHIDRMVKLPESALSANARDLELDLEWFARVLEARLQHYFGKSSDAPGFDAMAPPNLSESESPYAAFLRQHELSPEERAVLLLALIPVVRPQLLDVLWSRDERTGRGFTEFGGVQGTNHGGFIPTGETALFLLAGDDLAGRFRWMRVFDGDHLFAQQNVLWLGPAGAGESFLAGPLVLAPEYGQRFTTTYASRGGFPTDFLARRIQTQLAWETLVLPEATLDQLEEIKHWIQHGDQLLNEWDMAAKLRPGFTSLFHGPSGTGKTLSACLLGKHCGRDVYRVDLSMVVSKYIGETEKNLARVFDRAEEKGWILFFDEADSLFGRRTRVDSAHDRYANQETSFLLQRIEDFSGVVILASNLRNNIDDAFVRRFHSVIYFPMPRPDERYRIWRNAFSPKAVLHPRVDLAALAERHELSGGTIMNVVRYSSLKALSRDENVIRLDELEEGIRLERMKEGRAG